MLSFRAGVFLTLGCALLSTAASTAEVDALDKRVQCYSGPMMIVTHGTGESGQGALGYVTTAFTNLVPNSGSMSFEYPASMNNYTHSERVGVRRLKQNIRRYIDRCGPRSKIILLGYSQGAQVVSDTLSGGTFYGPKGRQSVPLIGRFARHIVGVLQFGDPAFTVGLPWDAGTAGQSGIFPRSPQQKQHLARYASIMKSYCDRNDPYCAGGKKTDANLKIHGEYFQKYTDEATNWLVRKYRARQ